MPADAADMELIGCAVLNAIFGGARW